MHVPLSGDLRWAEVGGDDLVELDRALDELKGTAPYKLQIVELGYFLGCTDEEAALAARATASSN